MIFIFLKVFSVISKNWILRIKSSFTKTLFIEGMQPMELETRQRNMMAEKMGSGGWHIQMDGDEYAYDFGVLAKVFERE